VEGREGGRGGGRGRNVRIEKERNGQIQRKAGREGGKEGVTRTHLSNNEPSNTSTTTGKQETQTNDTYSPVACTSPPPHSTHTRKRKKGGREGGREGQNPTYLSNIAPSDTGTTTGKQETHTNDTYSPVAYISPPLQSNADARSDF